MAVMNLAGFQTLINRNYREIVDQEWATTEDFISFFYDVRTSDSWEERIGSVGELDVWEPWTGSVPYTRFYEQYNARAEHRPFAQGLRWERELLDDDQTGIMQGDKYRKMVSAGIITRQQHAARLFNFATSNDVMFYTRSEGVPLASNSHTTRTPGVSTATGFDNLTTAIFSPTAYAAARYQMRHFANDRGNMMDVIGDCLVGPLEMEGRFEEVIRSQKDPDSLRNAVNPWYNQVEVKLYKYWNDTNDWALVNKKMMKERCIWYDRVKPEFQQILDFDTKQLKASGYGRWSNLVWDWRFMVFASVS